jgi:DNA recombination protein RmuC
VPSSLDLLFILAGCAAFFALLSLILLIAKNRASSSAALNILELSTRLEQSQLERARAVDDLDATRADLSDSQERYGALRESDARLEERSREALRGAQEKIELLQGAREQMKAEFNVLANRIFEEKSERMVQNNKASLETTLGPLKTQLTDFKKKVEDVYDKESRDRVSLQSELEHLKKLNTQMSEDAVNLTRALKGDKKTQGNWGEVVLERILEQSGLRKGTEYETQVALKAVDGARRYPDVVIRLPDSKDVVVDAKMSLVDYEQHVNADNDEDKARFLSRHVTAIGNHISSLSVKEYEKLEGIRSLDFVLMFVPIESAFIAAFDADPDMFIKAYDKQVIVVGPTTLLVTLRTIQTIWRYEHQNRNAEKIAAQAGGIFDQFSLIVESLDDVGRSLGKAQDSFDQAHKRLSTGKGNMVKRVQQLQNLGARTKKKMPASVLNVDEGLPKIAADTVNVGIADDSTALGSAEENPQDDLDSSAQSTSHDTLEDSLLNTEAD